MISLVGLILGVALLLGGGTILVRGASELAARYGVPPIIVALTVVAFGLLLTFATCGAQVASQDLDSDAARSTENDRTSAGPVLEEVVTTATKKSEAEVAQFVPAAISVLTGEDLAARNVTDVEDLSYALPNVALDAIGTGKGIANFSIRGLGIAGSIPSIDPTVGVFVDGMYLGVNYGVIVDMLDLEAVEILRGPQGLLFGRNVTGGAVLLRSRRPGGEYSANAAVRSETGLDSRFAGSIEGALADGAIAARFSVGYRNDQGWFENSAPGGGRVGAEVTRLARPVVTWTPSERLDVTMIYERGESDGDGPATQNRRRFDGFDFAIDEPGFSHLDWQHLVVEANRRLDLGRGALTNVFGWRTVRQDSLIDIDATVDPVFHGFTFTDQEQFSNELRYSGWFRDGWQATFGVYFFAQDIRYRERRVLRGVEGAPFGGDQAHLTGGIFMNNDIVLGDDWVLTVGGRYTVEEKDVEVATAGSATCVVVSNQCVFDFKDGSSWRNVTPKIGLQRWLSPRAQAYGHVTKGFRSGGYNLRNTSPTAPPGPFDEEEQDSLEAGLKSELAGGRARLNVAVFHNRIYGMQRQVTTADAAGGAIQVTANTADATIQGLETEVLAAVGRSGTISGFVGYTDGAYDDVHHDLNGDGSTVGDDQLELPRLARLTYGLEGRYSRTVGVRGELSVRLSFTHRDDSEITDDNRGTLDGGNLVDASLAYSPGDVLTFTLYGKNLLNEVLRRSDFDLSGLVDSTYSPLKEGRVLGVGIQGRL